MKNRKRIAKNTFALYIRTFLALIVSLYTSRIVLNALGVSDFGIFNVVGGVVLMLSFLNGAMASAAQRFLSYELGRENFKELSKVFGMILNIHFFIAIVVVLLAETVGLWFFSSKLNIPLGRENAALWVYQFSLLSFVFSVICVPYRGVIIARERMFFFAFLGIFEAVFKLIVAYLISTIDQYDRLIFYSFLMAAVSIIIYLICFFYCRTRFGEAKYEYSFDKGLFKRIFTYSGWNLFGNMALIFKNQGVNILLNMFFGTTVNAARGIAFQISNATMTFVYNIQTALNPQIIKSYAANDIRLMHNLIVIGTKISFFFMLVICFPIYMNLDFFLKVWLVNIPDYTILFSKLIIINLLIDTISESLKLAAMANGKIRKYQIVTGGLLLLSLPVTLVLLKLGFGPESGFLVSIGLSFIALFVRLHFLRSMIKLNVTNFISKVICRCALVVCPAVVVAWSINTIDIGSLFATVVIKILIIVIALFLFIFSFGFNKKERSYAVSLIRNKIKNA